jgi:hypothetical protein
MSETYSHDGQYTLSALSIVAHNGSESDLIHIFQEINIFEDVLSCTMSGNIVLHDGVNLISNLPIIGGETLKIAWSTTGKEDRPIKKDFVVHRIGPKAMISEKARSYALYFTSPEQVYDVTSSIVRYIDGTASSMVERIYTDNFRETDKPFEVEQTKNIHSVIPCHWSPFQTINYLSKLAISKNSDRTGFLFYESNRGFHFKSVETLYEQEPSVEYSVMPAVGARIQGADEIQERLSNIKAYSIGETGHILDSISSGAFSHNWAYLDVFSKKCVSTQYDYKKDFDRSGHVDEHKVIPEETPWMSKMPNARFMRVVHPGSNKGNRTSADFLRMSARHALLAQMFLVENTVEIYGDSDLFVGMTADFEFPAPEKMDQEFLGERFYSGKHLISAIRHTMTRDNYRMMISVVKDSLSDNPFEGRGD